ncbi:MAG: RidA family protein [Planctomycetota bacterium]
MNSRSRRDFLQQGIVAVPVAAVVGASTRSALAQTPAKREVVSGVLDLPFSRAVKYGGLIHVSGVMGNKPGSLEMASADFEPQCRQTLENLKASVEAAGATMASVLKCTCFLTDAADFETMNKVYKTFFPTSPPARSTVVVKALVLPGGKIEIDCVACVA